MAAASGDETRIRASWPAIIAAVLTSLTGRDLVLLAFWLLIAAIVLGGGLWVWDYFLKLA